MSIRSFHLNLVAENEAFHPNYRMEICAILREVVKEIDEGIEGAKCRDSNGNTVGRWSIDND